MTSYSSTSFGHSVVQSAEALDDNFFSGTRTFQFPNEDVYEGGFMAHRNGLVWREGFGTYKTKDGQIYSGKWYNDKLVEGQELEITYSDGCQYIGSILNNQYNGPAIYKIDNNMCMLCEFSQNKPIGDMTLLDLHGRIWSSAAGEADCLFRQEHIFFSDISDQLGKGKRSKKCLMQQQKEKRRRSIMRLSGQSNKMLGISTSSGMFKTMVKAASMDYEDEKDREREKEREREKQKKLEMMIFAKTKKTLSDLKFQDSSWYQNYEKFKKYYEDIIKKIETSGFESLNSEERLWNNNYLEFRKKYQEIMERRKNKNKKLEDYDLWELFTSEEYKKSYPPVKVIYPSVEEESSESSEDLMSVAHPSSIYKQKT